MSENDYVAAYVVYSTLNTEPDSRRYWFVCFAQNVAEAVTQAAMTVVDELNEARGYKDADTDAPFERDDDIASTKVETPKLGYVAQSRDLNHTQIDIKRIKTIPAGLLYSETKDIKDVGTVGAFGVEYFGGWDMVAQIGERTLTALMARYSEESDTSDSDYEDTPWERLKCDDSFDSDESDGGEYDIEADKSYHSESEYDFEEFNEDEETDIESDEDDYDSDDTEDENS